MVTDEQVKLLRQKLMEGKTQVTAAAIAGMSERTARDWQEGPLPSASKQPRWWRTRPDPLEEVWNERVVPMLEVDDEGKLEATTVLDKLMAQEASGMTPAQLRTLQRRIRDWRAEHGPDKEVYFEQEHVPAEQGAFDFTDCRELGVTIAGQAFAHLLFHFVLVFSGWRWVMVALGETFEAMLAGLQGALWELGGVPETLRSDNLSAATHQLREGGRGLTRRYEALLAHYGTESSRIRPGKAHENGSAERGNGLTKSRLEQELVLRGSRDFDSLQHYESWVKEVIEYAHNRHVQERLDHERGQLKPLPAFALPSYTEYDCPVRKWSTVRVGGRTYSVPSRLIGHVVKVRVHPDVVEVLYNRKTIETMPRLRGNKEHRIDYRHIIWSLVRKPGAFAHYRYREELFPTMAFRRAYDCLLAWKGARADIEYLRILHLAASTMEALVDEALTAMLESGEPFDYVAVKQLAAPETPSVPEVRIGEPDPASYDTLLAGGMP